MEPPIRVELMFTAYKTVVMPLYEKGLCGTFPFIWTSTSRCKVPKDYGSKTGTFHLSPARHTVGGGLTPGKIECHFLNYHAIRIGKIGPIMSILSVQSLRASQRALHKAYDCLPRILETPSDCTGIQFTLYLFRIPEPPSPPRGK